MIEVKNLKKTYFKGKSNEIKVINDTTLSLPDTGLVSFLGPSGSGKTTLLNTIGGLDKADSGTIAYPGTDGGKYNMTRCDTYRRENIGYVFQNYLLIDELSVYDNLKLALEINDVTDPSEVKKRIEYALNAVGLYKYRKKPASALSGGQQQRVSIARALVKRSRIIIADEPTGNLDSENTVGVMNILKKISKNALVLLVTHNQEIADFYSDKIVYLKDGTVSEYKDNVSTGSLEGLEDKNIHLLDYQREEVKENGISFKIYRDEASADTDITIVVRNNTIYVDSKSRVEVVKDSGVKLLDDHKEALKKEDVDNFSYDNSWYTDGKGRNAFTDFFKELGEAFRNFFTGPKRRKVFNVIFCLIGILLGALVLLQTNYSTVAESSLKSLPDEENIYHLVGKYGTYSSLYDDQAIAMVKEGYVKGVFETENDSITLMINSSRKKSYTAAAYHYPLSYIEGESMLAGKMPEEYGSVVLGRNLADDILETLGTGYTYQSLLGLSFGDDKKVGGVSSKKTYGVYEVSSVEYGYNHLVTEKGLEYTLLSGTKPQSFGDVLLPEDDMESYKIGDSYVTFGMTLKICGFYKITSSHNPMFENESYSRITTPETVLAARMVFHSSNAVFEISDPEAANTYLAEYSFSLKSAYSYDYGELLKENQSTKKVCFIIEAVLLAVILVYTYFSERSRMISEVHDIGVFRSLGARRHRLVSKSLKDIFAKATLTTLLGYIIVLVFYYYIAGRINAITGTDTLSFSLLYSLLGILILYGTELIIGIIPLGVLLHKTPSEINSKYDI